MRIEKKATIETDVTVDILCNRCGKSCRVPVSTGPDPVTNECGLIEATVQGCYGSPALEDLTLYTFSICEPCLMDMFAMFSIPPTVIDPDKGLVSFDPNWRANARASYERHANEVFVQIMDAFATRTPATEISRLADGSALFQERGKPDVRISLTGEHYFVTISRDQGDAPLTLEEIEVARRAFAPSIPFDLALSAVRVAYDEVGRFTVVAFSVPIEGHTGTAQPV